MSIRGSHEEVARNDRGNGSSQRDRYRAGHRPARIRRITGRTGLVALLALAACTARNPGTGGPQTDPHGGPGGRVVAVLELDAPGQQNFVLHGTIPVPPGTFPRSDGMMPFSIRNWDGKTVPTQVELVSRYAKDAKGADVVEVLGRVERRPGVAQGQKTTYQVVENPHPRGKAPIKGEIVSLVSQPASVLLVAKDVYGHQYGVDLFEGVRGDFSSGQAVTMRKGVGATTVRTYGTMLPTTQNIGPPSGALPHLFGAHAYLTAWARDHALTVDLRINNGASGADGSNPQDNPLGDVYFRELEIWVPQGWTVVPDVSDPFFGSPHSAGGGSWTAFPIVKPQPNGDMHFMPSQAMMQRRLALCQIGDEAVATHLVQSEGLGFARRGPSPDGGQLYSWWNPATAAYFPQRHTLPMLDYLGPNNVENRVNAEFGNVRNHIVNGSSSQFPLDYPVFGWAHTWGVKYGGMTSGSEIFFFDGLKEAEAASGKGYRAAQMRHRMNTSRQAMALYNLDGEPTALEDWLVHGSQFDYINMNFFLLLLSGNDPFGFNQAPQFQVQHVRASGKQPYYETELAAFSPHDFQHYIRYTRNPKMLVWLGNDPMAKDDLKLATEIFRLSYNDNHNSPSGHVIVSGLKSDKNQVAGNPGVGFSFGRGPSWGIDVSLAAYSTGSPEYRALLKPWFSTIADVVADGQSNCNGFIQSHKNNKWLGGQYKARQSIEAAIIENMLWGLKESVFRDVDNARMAQVEYTLEQSLYAMIGNMSWNSSLHGPNAHLAVAPLNSSLPPYCGTVPSGGTGNGADKWMTWASFGYGYELTGDQQFLTRALEMAGGGNDLYAALRGGNFNNLEIKAPLISIVQ